MSLVTMTLQKKIVALTQRLTDREGESARRMARLVLKYAAGVDVESQIAHPERLLTADKLRAVDEMADRVMAGEPLSRILGAREFYGLSFKVSPATLDPRPETELLVDQALAWIRAQAPTAMTVLDLGTGTGCIPISILKNIPNMHAVAVDLSADAIAVATRNAQEHGVQDRLALIQSDWFSALSGVSFDLVVSNPPYIPDSDIAGLMPGVRDFDPILSLSGGADGLNPYRKIFSSLSGYLNQGGLGLFEIGIDQRDDITRLAVKSGLDVVQVWEDYAGIPRVIGVSVHRP